MENISRVNVLETTENLVDEGLEMRICQWLTRTNNGSQIAFHQLLVEIGFIEVVWSRDVHIVQTSDISMSSEVLQKLDLSQGSLRQDLFAEDICNLLDRNSLSRLGIGRSTVAVSHKQSPNATSNSPDYSVCTLAKLFCNCVFLVYDEVLVEHLKDLSAAEITHDV